MVNVITNDEVLSFMDGFSGYNQVCMNPKSEELTTFYTPKDIYCYKIMSFGPKKCLSNISTGHAKDL